MTLLEYHVLLDALEIDPIEAVIRTGPLAASELYEAARYRTLVAMLCEMFRGLADNMIDALEQVEGIDGSEIRFEWAGAIRKAVVKRVVHEASAVAARRAALNDFSLFN